MSVPSITWNPWHGCHKYSPGCANCYVYRIDARYGRDSSIVEKTQNFDLPLRRARKGAYKIPSGTLVYTCFTSDFFLEDADAWRPEIWGMMRLRRDLQFLFITKRISRFWECIPPDWGNGYENVHICCTAEDQERANQRLPLFQKAPIRRKSIVLEPLLGPVDLSPFLADWPAPPVCQVIVGGESGQQARLCDYDWILNIRRQCIKWRIPFYFKQTGAYFQKDGKIYYIPKRLQAAQAKKANINWGNPGQTPGTIKLPD